MFILPVWRGVLPRFPQLYGCFRKRRYPQIININRVFHYKPSILGETPPMFGNTHITVLPNMMSPFQKSSWPVNNCQPKPPHQKALQVHFTHGFLPTFPQKIRSSSRRNTTIEKPTHFLYRFILSNFSNFQGVICCHNFTSGPYPLLKTNCTTPQKKTARSFMVQILRTRGCKCQVIPTKITPVVSKSV